MRVIAGSAKGRHLKGPDTIDTRPILDRVKTALFDILAPDIVDSRFLDLFAGAGSVGIEALSRGATSATFIELSPDIVKLVKENLATTKLDAHAEVIRADAFGFLRTARAQRRIYDIVYVAPPQYKQMAAQALERLDREPLTEPDGMVVVQVHPRER
ncbi:MAG TPA: 16S rRNA (guanine(966)-N(2))-methyltransferase RsmD, partial [Ktedonobacterales bacterium]